jgi:hypothetical protein
MTTCIALMASKRGDAADRAGKHPHGADTRWLVNARGSSGTSGCDDDDFNAREVSLDAADTVRAPRNYAALRPRLIAVLISAG